MKHLVVVTVCLTAALSAQAQSGLPADYKGRPYDGKAQLVPGRVELAWYDLGGEGVAYHDADSANHGSGELNYQPSHCEAGVPDTICHFRQDEGVDISYVKQLADFAKPNWFNPRLQQLYVGWEENGEWTNYTIDVKRPGTYAILVLYSFGANAVALELNRKPAAECKLPIDTGSFHTWNKARCGTIAFRDTGLQLLTMRYNKGNNLAYFEFIPEP